MKPGRFPIHHKKLSRAAEVAVKDCLRVQPGETVLIASNPFPEVAAISQALYNAVEQVEALPTLIFQPRKTQLDFAEQSVYAAIAANPNVFISITEEKNAVSIDYAELRQRCGPASWEICSTTKRTTGLAIWRSATTTTRTLRP